MVSRAGIRKQDTRQEAAEWGFPGLPQLPPNKAREIIRHSRAAGTALFVLALMVYSTDTTGYVSAPLKAIAQLSKLDRDTVGKTIRMLRWLGELRVIRPGAGRRAPEWQITALSGEREGGSA